MSLLQRRNRTIEEEKIITVQGIWQYAKTVLEGFALNGLNWSSQPSEWVLLKDGWWLN